MSHNIKSLHTDFLEELELAQGRSSRTTQNYDHYLRRFYQQEGVEKVSDITQDAVRQFRRWLHEKHKAAAPTINYHLIALRQFLKYLARRDIEALSPEKIGLAKLGDREIDVLYPEEIDALLSAAAPTPSSAKGGDSSSGRGRNSLADLRDHALLQTLFSTGLRVSEAVSLDRDDIRSSGEISVRGKGSKVRVVFLSKAAQQAIASYVKQRVDTDPALFISHAKRSAQADDKRLLPRTVQRLIKKYATLAGLTKHITPHTLRHSFATDLLSNGADVRQVQQMLGHASITTTQVYTHLTDAHLKDVHQKFHRSSKSSPQERD